jgi:DNA-binding GntR family transcriptional regulator
MPHFCRRKTLLIKKKVVKMEVTNKFNGLITTFWTSVNFLFVFVDGATISLISALLGLGFTVLLNTRRAMREIRQIYLAVRAKDAAEVSRLLDEDLNKKKDDSIQDSRAGQV